MSEPTIDAIAEEARAFDRQADERTKHGFVPDLQNLATVDWFQNNVWREPEFAKLHWMPRITKILSTTKEKGGKVLEIGCGLGMLSLEMARQGLDVVGVDLSPQSINVANHYAKTSAHGPSFGSLEYLCTDILTTDLDPQSFDSVVFFRSLHHIPDLHGIMQRVKRWLKPKGKLIISEPVRHHFTMDSAFIAGLIRLLLPTWQPHNEKCAGQWDNARWESYIEDIFEEYTYHGEHEQSPMDNSLDDADMLCQGIGEYFHIEQQYRTDAFIDKIIGGLRGPDRFELAKFLCFFDQYLIDKKILPGTSLELFALNK